MRTSTIRTFATGLAAAFLTTTAAGIASAAPDQPAQPAPDQRVTADVDGDGSPDTVTRTATELAFTVHGKTARTPLPEDEQAAKQPLRVTDVNGDGRQEIIVNVSAGANTDTLSVREYSPQGAIRELTTPDGNPLQLNEGGGVAAHLGYECAPSAAGRDLIRLSAENTSNGAEPTYDGTRERLHVQDGVATSISEQPFSGVTTDDPVVHTNPGTCS